MNGNRLAELGEELGKIFAPFERFGQPGEPSYVGGTGGDGQSQQGGQTGSGTFNPALTPYSEVFSEFFDFAQTSLDRNYIPLSVKDYVRDYFSSLNPSQ